MSRDPVLAEEILQEAYARALSARKQPNPPTVENLRPWLFTILRNHWYNEVRHRKGMPEPVDGNEGVCLETPDTVLCRRFLQSEVRDAVDALPEAQREVIVLREIESLTYAQIGELLGCPIGTVMSRLARARGQLRRLLSGFAPAADAVKPK